MSHFNRVIALCLFFALCLSSTDRWGFFAHKRINRLAVFTLPTPLIGFYKQHLQHLTDHAVDPDMRRYASKGEAPRHFMDLDRYGKAPFTELPRRWSDMMTLHLDVYAINEKGDTLHLFGPELQKRSGDNLILKGLALKKLTKQDSLVLPYKEWSATLLRNFVFYEEQHPFPTDTLKAFFKNFGILLPAKEVFVVDHFSEHGILPFHLLQMQYRLTQAFKDRDVNAILRNSADMGHYIGDAHVPLHTTENYNGQLTNQNGIHGFWESRIPELFADEQFDYFVGNATYIQDPQSFYWEVVLASHALVDSVLLIEKALSLDFSQDQIFAFDERNGQTIRTYSRSYSEAYHKRLDGMVESRMRAAILTIGCAWYTAWTDAGQPDIEALVAGALPPTEVEEQNKTENLFKGGKILGREHDN